MSARLKKAMNYFNLSLEDLNDPKAIRKKIPEIDPLSKQIRGSFRLQNILISTAPKDTRAISEYFANYRTPLLIELYQTYHEIYGGEKWFKNY